LPEYRLLHLLISGAGRLRTVGQGWVKDVDLGTVKDVAAGMVKDVDGGKEVHNLPRGCRDYKKYTGKNNNNKAMVNNRSEYR